MIGTPNFSWFKGRFEWIRWWRFVESCQLEGWQYSARSSDR